MMDGRSIRGGIDMRIKSGLDIDFDRFEDERPPSNLVLVGSSRQWQRSIEDANPCPICDKRPMPARYVCLGCCRAHHGFEAELALQRLNNPMPRGQRRYKRDDTLAGGVERVG
jgi:hypothetical protein